MTELLLLSNSTSPGRAFLEHALDVTAELVPAGCRLLFVPFAVSDHEGYTQRMRAALAPISAGHHGGDRRNHRQPPVHPPGRPA